jgi:hypothetical protein
MAYRYQKHYTRDEARALLPQVRLWLKRISQLRTELEKQDERLTASMSGGNDLGGKLVNCWVRTLVGIKEVLLDFHHRQIELKDLDRGLVDFPAILDGKEVFFCWEDGEEDIEFWHDLDAGYAGREPL